MRPPGEKAPSQERCVAAPSVSSRKSCRSPSHFFLEEVKIFTEFLCPTDHVVQLHPIWSWGCDSGDITIQLTIHARSEGKYPLFGAPGEKKKTIQKLCQTHRQDPCEAFFSLSKRTLYSSAHEHAASTFLCKDKMQLWHCPLFHRITDIITTTTVTSRGTTSSRLCRCM